MLNYTGHPLFDVGAAAILAFTGENDFSNISESSLDKVASFIEREYVKEPLKSFLGVAFTTNAWFNQPAFNNQPEKRYEYAERLLRSYNNVNSESSKKCIFTGKPITTKSFSDKLPPGRAFRQHIPLLTGEGVINFFPWGQAGLPVSGIASLCFQAFPMGCAKCGGRLLAVHSDNTDLVYEFAADFLNENRRALFLAHQAGHTKMPEARMSAKTLLIETLLRIESRRRDEAEELRPSSVTAYHLTNSGQSNPLDERNPPLDIYYLPLEITGFLAHLMRPVYKEQWNAIAGRAWLMSQPKKKGKKESEEGEDNDKPKRNFLYEDLFKLPYNTRLFVRRYFLRIPERTRSENDPRRSYSLKDEASIVSWKLTELFLGKVLKMDKDRIEQIRELGDRLAVYINGENDHRFFMAFYSERKYGIFRNALIKANLAHVKRGNPPLITLDPYIDVFEEGDEVARPNWELSRDLVLIRMIEQLYQLGWLGRNKDVLPDPPEDGE